MEKNNIAKQFFTTISPIEYGQRLPISINLKYVTHLHPWFGKETGEEEDEVVEDEDEEDKDIKGEDRTKIYLRNGKTLIIKKTFEETRKMLGIID